MKIVGFESGQGLRLGLVEGDQVGDIAPHYFSFGGIVQTARYARDAAAGSLAAEAAINRPS